MLDSNPAIHKPSRNKVYIYRVLKWIIEIIGDFNYTAVDYYDYRTCTNRIGMTFCGKVRDSKTNKYLNIEGSDLMQLNENGTKLIELKVMIRPLNSLIIFAKEMKDRVSKL